MAKVKEELTLILRQLAIEREKEPFMFPKYINDLLLCNKWSKKLSGWKQFLRSLPSHAMFVGQEFGWFWLWVSCEAAVMISAKATGIWRFDWGIEAPCLSSVIFKAGSLVDAGWGWRPLFLLIQTSPLGDWGSSQCESQLSSEWVIQKKARQKL